MNQLLTLGWALRDVLRRIYNDTAPPYTAASRRNGRRILKRPDPRKLQHVSVSFQPPLGWHTPADVDDVIEKFTQPLADQLAPLCRHFKRFAVLPYPVGAAMSEVITSSTAGVSGRVVEFWNVEQQKMEFRIDIAGY